MKAKKHKTVIIEGEGVRVAFNTIYPLPDYFSIIKDGKEIYYRSSREGVKVQAEIWLNGICTDYAFYDQRHRTCPHCKEHIIVIAVAAALTIAVMGWYLWSTRHLW